MIEISNPISGDQIVRVNIDDWSCMTAPECPDLNHTLQVIIDAVCDNVLDIEGIPQGCLDEFSSEEELFENIISKLCDLEDVVIPEPEDLSDLQLCDSDNWECGDSNCLVITDVCDNPSAEPTMKEVVQALIARTIALQDIICAQASTISDLTDRIDQLETDVVTIENNCCNINILNTVGLIQNSISSMQSNIETIEDDIDTIQATCCP